MYCINKIKWCKILDIYKIILLTLIYLALLFFFYKFPPSPNFLLFFLFFFFFLFPLIFFFPFHIFVAFAFSFPYFFSNNNYSIIPVTHKDTLQAGESSWKIADTHRGWGQWWVRTRQSWSKQSSPTAPGTPDWRTSGIWSTGDLQKQNYIHSNHL